MLSACGESERDSASGTTTGHGDPITIGFIADNAGPAQTFGIPSYNGARVIINQINEKGGVKIDGQSHPLELEVCQANSTPSQAVACAQRLVRDEGVKFIVGATGEEGPPVAAITDPAGVILMAPGTVLAQQIDKFKNVFVPLPNFLLRLKLVVAGVKHAYPDAKRIAFLAADGATNAAMPLLVEEFKKNGIETVSQQTFDINASDLTPQMTRAKASKPDVLWLGWALSEVSPALKAYQSIKVAPNVYAWTGGGNCAMFKDQIGDGKLLTNGMVGADLDKPDTPKAKQFTADFKEFIESGDGAEKSPLNLQNIGASLFYVDAIPLLVKAMEKTGTTTDTAKIVDAMEGSSIEGVQGTYSFGEDHQAILGVSHCAFNLEGPGVRSSFYLPPTAGK